MIQEIKNPNLVSALFAGWEETLIYSCLQGVMGTIYAKVSAQPESAMALLGDFAFFAGKPDMELIAHKPDCCSQDFIIMVPQNEAWTNSIVGFYGNRAKIVSRYAIKKEPDVFDTQILKKAVLALPEEYMLRMIDEPLYHLCRSEGWSADLVSQFPSYEDYKRLGLGAVILKNNRLVSGASSYSRYREGIEIEIDTKKEYRRKGLARVCGARLILECLKRGLYPSWDAQNTGSAALAEKLGYHYSHTYTAVEINGWREICR